jgi:hypothetical protein
MNKQLLIVFCLCFQTSNMHLIEPSAGQHSTAHWEI